MVNNPYHSQTVSILLVEDTPSDAELIKREVGKVLPGCEFLCVEIQDDFLVALESFRPDMILSDYSLPKFDGMKALELALEHVPETPFILVTGSVNEETAVKCMKAGAWDYVLKEHLKQLGSAIDKAFEQKRLQMEKKGVEQALRESESRYAQLAEQSRTVAWEVDADGLYIYVGHVAKQVWGYSPEELVGRQYFYDLHPEAGREKFKVATRGVFDRKESFFALENAIQTRDGELIWVSTNGLPILDHHGILKGYRGSDTDITERKHAEQALKESEDRYRKVVQDQTEFIIRYFPDGTRSFVNDSYCSAFNVSEKEALASNIFDSLPVEEVSRIKGKMASLSPENPVSTDEHSLKDGDGREIWHYWAERGIFDEKGKLKEIQAVGRDVTKRVEALLAAEKANDVKDQFVANISHEIRTPLNSILGFSDLFKLRYTDMIREKDRVIFDYIGESSARLMDTVDSILNISMLTAGTIGVHKETINLEHLVSITVNNLKLAAEKKNLSIQLISTDKQMKIFADKNCISSAIVNLIDNAIKYTNEGGVELKLEWIKGHATLSISDTGIGISDDYKQRIYEPYTQESEGFTKHFQGVGLGLALTKRYLDLNDA